jgi:Ca2+-binding RTX toxin-like protein
VRGGSGRDFLRGFSGDDVLRGGPGRDTVVDFAGADRLYGAGDKDTVVAYGKQSLVKGGAGNDACLSTADRRGGDVLRGGRGSDTYNADAADAVISAEALEICDTDVPGA